MRYKHVKRGTLYDVLGVGKIQTKEPLIDGDKVVMYVGGSVDYWARRYEEFHDGRFEKIQGSKKALSETRNDSDIVQVYFNAVKMAREHGLRIACRWEEGVFRLYKGDTLVGATTSIISLMVLIEEEITNNF